MLRETDYLSLGTLVRRFWGRISVTWALTVLETVLFALIPLAIGRAIDGLIGEDFTPFLQFCYLLSGLVFVAIGRRVFDTRAYGAIRVALAKAQAEKSKDADISTANARVIMGRELPDFLEKEAPLALTSVVEVGAALVILLSFHATLSIAAAIAAVVTLGIYWLASGRFYRLNRDLNGQSEKQVKEIESKDLKRIVAHFSGLKRHEIRLSDWESIIYGLIVSVLFIMLAFNLWFAATAMAATAGAIFSIVTYSLRFVESSIMLPVTFQTMTRLSEITDRINRTEELGEE